MRSINKLIKERFENKSNIFITSDIHAFHKNICAGSSTWSDVSGCRPFANELEMNDKIVENFNSVVGANDLIISLGDICFGHRDNLPKFLDRITCKNWIHVFGNHESHTHLHLDRFLWTGYYLELLLYSQHLCLFHFPIADWHDIGRGSHHYFGHVHANFKNHGRSQDVGVDTNNFFPYNLNELIKRINKVPLVHIGHH